MPSSALVRWEGERAARLDRLLAAHAALAGGPAGRVLEEELTGWMILRLASEFQGHCRALHDEAVDATVSTLATGRPELQDVLRGPLTARRRLDRGNADPGVLGHDFGLVGVQLWPDLARRSPTRGTRWRESLLHLNQVRNGLAHDDAPKVADARAAGWPASVHSARRWRDVLDELVGAMDDVVGERLAHLLGTPRW